MGDGDGAASAAEVAALRAAVYASPNDDAPRAVLADLWLAQGDPRGELVALQLGPPSDAVAARVRALLRDHAGGWFAPETEGVLQHMTFERGFPSVAGLAPDRVAPAEAWDRASRDPALATLTALQRGGASAARYAAFAASPALRGLRWVDAGVPGALAALAAGPPRPIETLFFARLPSARLLSRVVTSPALARARRLELVTDAGPDAVCALLGGAGLDRLLVGLRIRPPEDALGRQRFGPPWRPALARLAGALPALATLVLHGPGGASLTLSRRGAGWQGALDRGRGEAVAGWHELSDPDGDGLGFSAPAAPDLRSRR